MESFICMFCPAVVALLVYERIMKKKLEPKYALCTYLLFVLLVNCATITISRFAFGIKSSMSAALDRSPILVVKYAAIAIVLSVIIAVIVGVIKNAIKLNVVVKKDTDNGKNQKNTKNK